MGETLIPWDRIVSGVRRRLPEWARYRGKATWAVSAYIYAALLGVVAYVVYDGGYTAPAVFLGGLALVALLIGDYYRKAAKKRLECANCGKKARGWDECPHCGELTFVEGSP